MHPALTPFKQFVNAGEDLCKKILHGLANRLQLLKKTAEIKLLFKRLEKVRLILKLRHTMVKQLNAR